MGQEPSTMSRPPEQIRDEIAGTRHEMDRTLDAIEDRVHPRRIAQRRTERVRQGWSGLKDRVMGEAGDLGERASARTSGSGDSLADGVRQAPETLQRQTQGNPIAAGLIAFGAGLLAASVLPKTEAEQQAAGQAAQRLEPVKSQLTEAGREMAQATKEHAQEAAEQTKQTARDAATAVGEDASSSAQHLREEGTERAGSVQETVQQQRG